MFQNRRNNPKVTNKSHKTNLQESNFSKGLSEGVGQFFKGEW